MAYDPRSVLGGTGGGGGGSTSIVQIVTAEDATYVTNSTTTYTDTGLSASITPTSASNKILVLVIQASSHNGANAFGIQLLRAGGIIWGPQVMSSSNSTMDSPISIQYLDAPATTSAITYKTQFNRNGGSGNTQVNDNYTPPGRSMMMLIEIAGV